MVMVGLESPTNGARAFVGDAGDHMNRAACRIGRRLIFLRSVLIHPLGLSEFAP